MLPCLPGKVLPAPQLESAGGGLLCCGAVKPEWFSGVRGTSLNTEVALQLKLILKSDLGLVSVRLSWVYPTLV